MTRYRPRLSSPLLVVPLLLGLPANALADGIEHSSSARPGGRLVIEADATSVDLVGGRDDEVSFEIRRGSDEAEEIERDYDIRFEQQGEEVRLEIRKRRQWRLLSWPSRRGLQLRMSVPRSFDVDIETSGGKVDVEEIAGEVKVQTSGGSLRLESIDGPVKGRTSGGSVRLDDIRGPVEVRTSGGSIHVGRTTGAVSGTTSGGNVTVERAQGPITVETSGGSIEIQAATDAVAASTSGGSIRLTMVEQPTGDSRLTTSGGSVTVFLADSLALDIEAHASGGRVHSDLVLDRQVATNARRLTASLNGGGPELYLRSSGGSVHLRHR